jgi:hypothetical protein
MSITRLFPYCFVFLLLHLLNAMEMQT